MLLLLNYHALYISGINKIHHLVFPHFFSCCMRLANYLSSSDLKGLTFKPGTTFKKKKKKKNLLKVDGALTTSLIENLI